ncbi:hypothetical protein JCM10212_003154 [Sporobolomyces blumeae]
MSDAETVPGRRAKLARDALLAASRKTIKVLDDKAMAQCFPEYAQTEQRLLAGLKEMVTNAFNEAIPVAWSDLVKSANFIEKANELDAIIADAEARKKRNEQPQHHYAIGADGTFTIPSATVPILRSATEELKEKRLALADQNAEIYERVATLSTTTEASEAQVQQILDDFQKTLDNLNAVDEKRLLELRDKMVAVIGDEL